MTPSHWIAEFCIICKVKTFQCRITSSCYERMQPPFLSIVWGVQYLKEDVVIRYLKKRTCSTYNAYHGLSCVIAVDVFSVCCSILIIMFCMAFRMKSLSALLSSFENSTKRTVYENIILKNVIIGENTVYYFTSSFLKVKRTKNLTSKSIYILSSINILHGMG